jgi:hypothetical protein
MEEQGRVDAQFETGGAHARTVALLEHYVGPLAAISNPAAPASAVRGWQTFDRVTCRVARRGASRDAVKLMTVGADSAQVSALYVIRQYAMLRTSTER